MFELIKSNIFFTVLISTALQILGTLILALFSFYGLEISNDEDAYVQGIQKVEIRPHWLSASKFALIILLVGLTLSGLVSIAVSSIF